MIYELSTKLRIAFVTCNNLGHVCVSSLRNPPNGGEAMEGCGELFELEVAAKAWMVDAFESLIELLAAIAQSDNRLDVEETCHSL